ncbi:polymorphic toxin-type HINT domain-containing protein [Actinoplanes sp. NPDC049599]|uniref:polymorphic toxin-type HINT domain-containing protein n=1 Tax=Actinoplanes sp. NPDC049599 TaxID=3363903 RepID=UPI0037BB2D5E
MRRRIAVVTVAAMAGALLQAVPAEAAPTKPEPLKPQAGVSIGGKPVKAIKTKIPTMASTPARTPKWPAAGTSTMQVTADGTVKRLSKADAAAPLDVRATDGKAKRLTVEVLGRAEVAKAHRDVVMRLRPADTASAGKVNVTIDYTDFGDAYGADWSDRLRLVSLPPCALTTPDAPGCAATPLASTNNGTSVSAPVTVSAAGSVVALAAAAAGSSGDYAATSLSASATWNAGGSSGTFGWSYPMSVPPSLGGPAPNLSLDYSSQAVDGRTSVTNNQPSWIGEGFGFEPGFIERRYASCGDDNDDDKRKGNNTNDTGDQCWGTDNATLSLDGVGGGELIYNSTEKRWHTRSDDGTRIERLYNATNGDKGDTGSAAGGPGEYWVVTATNGTKYYFGLNRLPGYSATNSTETKSVFTVPVAGNQSGEPCNKTAFKDSFCDQAWRWNLDWVVDTNGNAESFWYSPETNKYARNSATDVHSYVRGGNVTRIDYGQMSASAYAKAPMSVSFGTANRCLTSCTVNANWQDTPLDQECTGTSCTQYGPTFFTKRRLSTVTTQVLKPGTTTYRDVERWTLTHTFPDPGDGTRKGMWLSTISHTGWDAKNVATSVPDITLVGVPMDNRVDTALSNGLRPMRWYRMKTIYTETQASIDVNYLPTNCAAGSTPDPATNTKRCFPVRWAPPDLGGAPGKEITDWFHKYVVDSVRENDTKSPLQGYPLNVLTSYKYDTPAWRYADDDGLTKDKYRTWSQWRGYGLVSVIKGDDGDRTRVDTRYFRGMDGDKSTRTDTVGTKRANVTDSKGKATIVDADDLNGQIRETVVYNGPDGEPISGTISDPWLGTITATHKVDDVSVNARYIDTAGSWTWTARDGGRPDTWTHTTTAFDTYGMPTEVTEFGDTTRSGDEKCVLTDYSRDDGPAWMIAFPYQVRTFALTCDEATEPGRIITKDEVLGATRASFDDKEYGVAPTKGLTTMFEALEDWKDNKPVYYMTGKTKFDVHGRPSSSWDADNLETKTTYTPVTGGPLTRVDAVSPLKWTSYNLIDPATGTTTLSHDLNGRDTETLYDGLGRLISVWKPGRSSAAGDVPDVRYTYKLNTDKASVVQTDTLNANNKITTSYMFFDSLLRPVQQQTPAATTGMLVTDTFYDTAGRANVSYGAYWVDGTAPSATRWQPPMPAGRDNILSWSKTLYDGAGRETNKILFSKLAEKWRATTVYGGDHVDTTPPLGGTAESKYVDPRGRTTEIRQYKGPEPVGDYERTTYGYNTKGQLTKVTDPMETVWEYGYDVQGRQDYTKDPDKGEVTTSFDKLGRVLSTKDQKGQVLAYKYDDLGRKTGMFKDSLTGTKLADWTYDSLTGGLGVLASSNRYVDGDLTNPYTTATLALDAKTGLPTKTAVTIPGSEKGLAGTYTYQARYAVNGAPKTSLLPAIGDTSPARIPGETLTTGYNDLGAATTLSTTIGGSLVPAVEFTEFGEISSVVFGASDGKALQVTNHYDPSTRRLRATQAFRDINPAVVSWKEYQYDDAGNIIRTEEKAPVAGAETQCWRMDHLQRLTDAWTPSDGNCDADPSPEVLADSTAAPAPYWTSWSFNASGNRLQQIEHKTAVGIRTTDYAYPAGTADHPHFPTRTTTTGDAGTSSTADYEVDELGNTISRPTAKNGQQALTWNAEGQLASAQDSTGTTTYVYDADGNRLITKEPTGKTLYLPGQEIKVDNNGTVQSCTRYYSYGGKTVAQRTSAGLTWLVSDTQNTASISVDAVTQQATVRHLTAYGEDRDGQAGWINDKGFLGKTIDNTGLTHVEAREYDPGIGRFISVDPIMDVTDPQQMQGYSYANNSPVSFADPSGESVDTGNGSGNGQRINPDNGDVLDDGTGQGSDFDNGTGGGTGGTSGGNGGGNGGGDNGGATNSGGHKQPAKCNWWCKSKKWTSDHKATIAAVAVGVVVGVGCGFAIGWTGVGAVACGALAGAAGSIAHDLVEGGHSVADMAGNAVVSGVIGGITGGLMSVGGQALSTGVRSLVTNQGAQAARQAAAGAAKAEAKSIGASLTKPFAKCPTHSFAPSTAVLMADGSAKSIAEVRNGDVVQATDPRTGESAGQKVIDLHEHHDTALTNLTVETADGRSATLHTTQGHPFWSVSRADWVDAEDLAPDERLHADDGGLIVVRYVDSFVGNEIMHDLTVDEVHTYYVLANETPVLVHNCGPARFEVDSNGVVKDLTADMARASKNFTRAGKRHVANKSRANNAGRTVCDDCGIVTIPATRSMSGVAPARNETRIDHIWPRSLGGPGSLWNGRVTCVLCNERWSNTPKGPL